MAIGHTVESDRIAMEEDKLDRIQDAAAPETKKQVEFFLGLAGYYTNILSNFLTCFQSHASNNMWTFPPIHWAGKMLHLLITNSEQDVKVVDVTPGHFISHNVTVLWATIGTRVQKILCKHSGTSQPANTKCVNILTNALTAIFYNYKMCKI